MTDSSEQCRRESNPRRRKQHQRWIGRERNIGQRDRRWTPTEVEATKRDGRRGATSIARAGAITVCVVPSASMPIRRISFG